MTLYEIGLSKTGIPNTAHPSDFQRLEILYACLESVGKFFDNFLDIPPVYHWNSSLVHSSHLAHALSILQRLSTFKDPTWDLRYVTEKVNFSRIVDQVCNRMREALTYGGIEPLDASENTNLFARAVSKLGKLSSTFEAQMASTQSASDETSNLDTGDIMNLESMGGLWEQDWFDVMGTLGMATTL